MQDILELERWDGQQSTLVYWVNKTLDKVNELVNAVNKGMAQTNAQQMHGEICSAHICDYCVKYRSDACRAALCGMGYPMFMGRKLSPC